MQLEHGETEEHYVKLKKRYFVIAILISFFVNFDSSASIPIITNYAVTLGASTFMAGLIAGAYSITHIPSNIILGRIVDKSGRKTPLFTGLALDGFSLFLYSISSDPLQLLLARLIHGAGGGFGGPASMSYVGDAASKNKSGRIMAIYGIMTGLSYLLGFMLGGMGAFFLGYRKLYELLAAMMFLAALISLVLPETKGRSHGSLPLQEELKIFKETISNKFLVFSYIAIFAISFNQGIIVSVYALILSLNGYSTAMIGMFFSVMVIVSIVIHYPSGLLGDKIGKEKVIFVGLVLQTLSFIVFMGAVTTANIILGMAINGLGHGLVYPNGGAMVRDHTLMENRGLATGVFYALLVAGVAVGAPLSSYIAELEGLTAGLTLGLIIPMISLFLTLYTYTKYLK